MFSFLVNFKILKVYSNIPLEVHNASRQMGSDLRLEPQTLKTECTIVKDECHCGGASVFSSITILLVLSLLSVNSYQPLWRCRAKNGVQL